MAATLLASSVAIRYIAGLRTKLSSMHIGARMQTQQLLVLEAVLCSGIQNKHRDHHGFTSGAWSQGGFLQQPTGEHSPNFVCFPGALADKGAVLA